MSYPKIADMYSRR